MFEMIDASAEARSCEAVEVILGPELAGLRARVLSTVAPKLELAVSGLPEEAQAGAELRGALAHDEAKLLDARSQDGATELFGISRLVVATEALATYRQALMMPVLLAALPSLPLLLYADGEQQERFLPLVRQGEAAAAFALSEPNAGSDMGAMATIARKDGRNYVLSGKKSWVSAPADVSWFLVFARQDSVTDARTRLSCFVIERDAAGLTIEDAPVTLGMRSVPLATVSLHDVRVPLSQRVGAEGDGFKIAVETLNAVRPIVAARGLGLTASVLMAATRYTEQRRAFGETLFDLQLVRTKLADLAAKLEAARLLTYRAAALVDAGRIGKADASLLAAAKLIATELAVEASATCLHVCGAAGYTEELPLADALRDAHQLTIVEGTSEVQLELVARGLADRFIWWDESRA